MKFGVENIAIIIFAVVAVVLQLLVAPYVTIAGATPNFIAAYVLAVAVVRMSSSRVVVLAFILGLCYNLFSGGPVGGMAFALVATSFVAGRLLFNVDNDTFFFPVLFLVVSVFFTELIYGIITVVAGASYGFGDMFLLRVLPCTVYDMVIGFIWYVIMRRAAAEPTNNIPNINVNDSLIIR